MSKIYVVTKGSYSDYHVVTATTDEDVANKIAKKFSDSWDRADVEVYEDAEIYMKPVFYVCFEQNGDVHEICDESSNTYYYDNINECDFEVDGERVYAVVQADNEEHAIKIASEKRAEFLARKAGIA
jgi:hypothetical protein